MVNQPVIHNHTRLSSLEDEAKDVTKIFVIFTTYILYSTMKSEDTKALKRQRAWWSKIKARYSRLTC